MNPLHAMVIITITIIIITIIQAIPCVPQGQAELTTTNSLDHHAQDPYQRYHLGTPILGQFVHFLYMSYHAFFNSFLCVCVRERERILGSQIPHPYSSLFDVSKAQGRDENRDVAFSFLESTK